jgi:peroxiredoxin family protein
METAQIQREQSSQEAKRKNKLVMVVSKGTMDTAYPALILATTAASQGMEVYMYFTFGGMKLLTKGQTEGVGPSVDIGMTKQQMVGLISKGGMPSIDQMMNMAIQSGVRVNACSPTMNLFGTTKESLAYSGVDVCGAATFLEWASDPDAITLFL